MQKVYLVCEPVPDTQALACVNAIVWDDSIPYTPPAGAAIIVQQGEEWIGWTYANGVWTAPPAPPPNSDDAQE